MLSERKIIATISLLLNFFAAFSCICTFAETGLAGFKIGEFLWGIKFDVLFFTALKTWFSCKDATIRTMKVLPKILSVVSLFLSAILIAVDYIIKSPLCEVSDKFVIIFSGEAAFLNETLANILITVKPFLVIFMLCTFIQCVANILEIFIKKK